MSDILIRGMGMPKYGCDNCFLRTGNYCGRIDKDESVVKYARKSERHPDCPIIELSPHGRLIDADAAVANRNTGMNWCYDLYDLPDYLAGCPTIIPADKED